MHWLVPRAALHLHNWQGTAIVQSGNAAPDAPVALVADRGTHPIWAAGLTGAGQVIGAGDSGIGERSLHAEGLSATEVVQAVLSECSGRWPVVAGPCFPAI